MNYNTKIGVKIRVELNSKLSTSTAMQKSHLLRPMLFNIKKGDWEYPTDVIFCMMHDTTFIAKFKDDLQTVLQKIRF